MLTNIRNWSGYTHSALLAAGTANVLVAGTNVMDYQPAPIALRLIYTNAAGSIVAYEWVDDLNIPYGLTNSLLRSIHNNATIYRKFPNAHELNMSTNVNGATHTFFLPNPPAFDFRVHFDCFNLFVSDQAVITANPVNLTYVHK